MDLTEPLYDTHVHVWTLDESTYPWSPVLAQAAVPDTACPPQLVRTQMNSANVPRALLVQPSTYGWDHTYLLQALDSAPGVFAGVVLVDPSAPSAEHDLRSFEARPGVRGVRFHALDSRQAEVLSRMGPNLLAGAAASGLVVDVQMHPATAGVVEELARRVPQASVVVDHLGLVAAGGWRSGIGVLRPLADLPNVSVKLSGLEALSRDGFPFADCRDLADWVIAAFGPRRVMWGSNFPHVRKACGYAQAADVVREWLASYAPADRHEIAYGTAARVWGSSNDVR